MNVSRPQYYSLKVLLSFEDINRSLWVTFCVSSVFWVDARWLIFLIYSVSRYISVLFFCPFYRHKHSLHLTDSPAPKLTRLVESDLTLSISIKQIDVVKGCLTLQWLPQWLNIKLTADCVDVRDDAEACDSSLVFLFGFSLWLSDI